MDPKTIGIGVIAVAALVVSVAKTDTSKMVAATQDEDTKSVAAIVQTSGVNVVTCCRDWVVLSAGEPVLKPVCSDTGYDPTRLVWLEKKLGAKGQCIQFDPKELADGNVTVAVTVQEGTARAQPAPVVEQPPIEEIKTP